ncbi:MAG: hypothetical protein PHE06_10200 [Lachnospiraceae bacterium]|nr:hypothetical protein [Lachnospiraceae bacterium]
MNKGLKRGLVFGMTVCLAASSLAGCSSKSNEVDTAAAIATFDGADVPAGVVNFLLRYQQAGFETNYGSFLKSYYGEDIWNADLSGSGTAYGDTFKSTTMDNLEKMLLCEKHMSDYGVELTEDETAAIKTAAADFVAANGEDVLKKMSATEESVARVLTLYTIQNKMETQMSADVDTEVSDEEAAQRTVSYVSFSPIETEASTESETAEDTAEGVTEATTEAAGGKAETETEAAGSKAETETEAATTEAATTEAVTEKATEAATTEAAVTEAAATKTGSADTEAETEAETAETKAAAAEAEAEDKTAAAEDKTAAAETEAETTADQTEAVSEGSTEAVTEAETETEDAAAIAAKAEAQARAEAFLETARTADDFAAAAAEAADADENASTSSYTFGSDDTYPDTAIITATEGLEDNTLVPEVIYANNAYYVLHVDSAFDEAATEEKKTEIVNTRKQDAISALYDSWMEEVEFVTDEDLLAKLNFDYSLMMETEAATEAVTEAGSEAAGEDASEVTTEGAAEDTTEAAVTEAAETAAESDSEAETETTAK